jgi:hypothetical protein
MAHAIFKPDNYGKNTHIKSEYAIFLAFHGKDFLPERSSLLRF